MGIIERMMSRTLVASRPRVRLTFEWTGLLSRVSMAEIGQASGWVLPRTQALGRNAVTGTSFAFNNCARQNHKKLG